MILRAAKAFLVFGVAVFYTILVFNNLTDYDSNYQFVRHVLMMDSTFAANLGMWRALNSPAMHTAFSLSLITWESLTMLLSWWGGWKLARAISASPAEFHQAKRVAITALPLALLMW